MRDSESEKNQCRNRKAGLTRVTKLVIVASLGFVLIGILVSVKYATSISRIKMTHTYIAQIANAVYAYAAANDAQPDSLDELLRPSPPDDHSGCTHCFDPILRDVWGTPFRYTQQGTTFTITSAGPDKEFGTADDISQTNAKEET